MLLLLLLLYEINLFSPSTTTTTTRILSRHSATKNQRERKEMIIIIIIIIIKIFWFGWTLPFFSSIAKNVSSFLVFLLRSSTTLWIIYCNFFQVFDSFVTCHSHFFNSQSISMFKTSRLKTEMKEKKLNILFFANDDIGSREYQRKIKKLFSDWF